MPKIFISYANEDYQFIKDYIIRSIRDVGFEWFFSKDKISLGEKSTANIFDNLQTSDYFLLVMSKHSMVSEWVKAEVDVWCLKKKW